MLMRRDQGYAWVVCGASFFMCFIYGGVVYSMGMFYILFKENMDADSTTISSLVAVQSACFYLSSLISGILITKYGERRVGISGALVASFGLCLASISVTPNHLYPTYGILTGIGIGLQYTAFQSVIPIYFDKWLSLVTGLTMCGIGVGSCLFPYILYTLEEVFAWRGALLICGGAQLQGVVCSALFGPKPQETNHQNTHCIERKETDLDRYKTEESLMLSSRPNLESNGLDKGGSLAQLKSILSMPVYILYCTNLLFLNTGFLIVYNHIGDSMITSGFTQYDASLFFLVTGISNTAGRFLSGAAAQVSRCHPLYLCLLNLPLGFVTIFFSCFTTFPLLMLYAIILGVFMGPGFSLHIVFFRKIMTAEKIPVAIGFIQLALTPGALAGPTVAGWIYDTTRTYVYSFYLGGVLMLISGVLIVFCICCKGWKSNRRIEK